MCVGGADKLFQCERITELLRTLGITPLSESLVFQEGYGCRCQDLLGGESKDHGSDKTLLNYRHDGLLFHACTSMFKLTCSSNLL